MGSNYLFSLEPTFTQGLVLGQLTVTVFLVLLFKYSFLDSSHRPLYTFSYQPRIGVTLHSPENDFPKETSNKLEPEDDPIEWLNALIYQVVNVYRSKLRDDLAGSEGDEVARMRVENFANTVRSTSFLDHIIVHSVDFGTSAPRILQTRLRKNGQLPELSFDVVYEDSLSITLSTAYLFNYPTISFARLPVSMTISLQQFKSSISVTPPHPDDLIPAISFSISPDFKVDLNTTSLLGSRAKLANVPKLHELIQSQVRRLCAARGTWRVVLPKLVTLGTMPSPLTPK